LLKVALNTKNQINLLKNRHICNRRIIETQWCMSYWSASSSHHFLPNIFTMLHF
jgi:hypothetical protein